MITYRAVLDVPHALAQYLSRLLNAERRERGTRKNSRALTCFRQAVFGLRWFREDRDVAALARDCGISRATGYRYLDEIIEALAAQAPGLHDALRKAKEAGVTHLVLDGKLFSGDRLGEKTTSVKGEQIDAWYSGKHREQGGNVQALMEPDGFPLPLSEVEPGSTHDITAAREHVLGALYWAYSHGDWPAAQRRLASGDHVVRLEGFRSQPSGSLTVIGREQHRLTLLVIPPETSPDVAEHALTTAADRGNTGDGAQLLGGTTGDGSQPPAVHGAAERARTTGNGVPSPA